MPDWQPNWEDVVFDHAKASAAATECRLAAGSLLTVADGLVSADGSLASDAAWQGAYRDDYSGERPRVATELRDARTALVALANKIEAAAADATTEQRRREADRTRWRAERDSERELARPRGPR